jgi:multidrug efflux pump subunit AcrA (membrane-fusion protein)
VLIDSTDERLKPGMSAKTDIVIAGYDDVLSVPIEAVFERDDTTIVFGASGKKIPVSLGERNDISVIITSGLEDDDEICLLDPTRKLDEAAEGGTPGAKKPKKKSNGASETTIIIGG